MSDKNAALAWYRPEDYDTLRAVFDDGDELDETYEEWLAGVQKLERQLQANGIHPVHVILDLDTFTAWCQYEGLPRNAAARSRFAAEQAMALSRKTGREGPD